MLALLLLCLLLATKLNPLVVVQSGGHDVGRVEATERSEHGLSKVLSVLLLRLLLKVIRLLLCHFQNNVSDQLSGRGQVEER